MIKRTIRVKFVDWCWDLQDQNNYFYPYLEKFWHVEIVKKNPDYIFCSCFGREHIKYDGIKIFFSGENVAPDFNWYDYAIGSDWLQLGDRYLRVPLYAFYPSYQELICQKIEEKPIPNKFCSFVVSNNRADPIRDYFFECLSKYKKVDSGGLHLNNIGKPVLDKVAFCAQYKFNIAFENCSYPGYTTEKIVQALSAGSVPIYWGNPDIAREFSPECMIRVKDRLDIERAIQEIVRLDQDDLSYKVKLHSPNILIKKFDFYKNQIEVFLRSIIDQPIESARRIARSGFQRNIRNYQNHAFRTYDFLRRFWPK